MQRTTNSKRKRWLVKAGGFVVGFVCVVLVVLVWVVLVVSVCVVVVLVDVVAAVLAIWRRLRAQARRLPRVVPSSPSVWFRWLVKVVGFVVLLVGFVAAVLAILEYLGDRPPPLPDLRIVELLPNPRGSDEQCERIRLRNSGREAVDLRGWRVRDASSATWALDVLGSLAPGRSTVLWREGRGMSLNNTGDTVELIDDQGRVLQKVRYPEVLEGQVVVVTRRGVEIRFDTEPLPASSVKEPEPCRTERTSSFSF